MITAMVSQYNYYDYYSVVLVSVCIGAIVRMAIVIVIINM